MIYHLHVLGREQSTAFIDAKTLPQRGTVDRRIMGRDLIEFGRCPWRWRFAPDPEDYLLDQGPNLVEWLYLDPDQARSIFARRPETYEAPRLECPRCHSPGPALTCTKCGTRRKTIVTARPWTAAAKQCAAWLELTERSGKRIITPSLWDAADMAAQNLHADRAVSDLKGRCTPLRVLEATWSDETTGVEFPIWARVSLHPPGDNSPYQVLAQIIEPPNADPAVWEAQAYSRGAHIRASLALLLWNSQQVAPVREFLWIIAEKSPPRVIARRRASPELLAEGRTRLLELLASYAACLKADQWPRFEPEDQFGTEAFSQVALQPWMTSGTGPHGGYFAPTVMPPHQSLPMTDAPPA